MQVKSRPLVTKLGDIDMQNGGEQQHENVREYYGKVLATKDDLKTNACCSTEVFEPHIKEALAQVHPRVLEKFYGCGSPIPPALLGQTVLDLGCGSGRDCFVLSKLVGEQGQVIGVDMTEEQLAVAREHQSYHAKEYGYAKSNIRFEHGIIEDLESLEIANNSVDVVVSNCVINLSPRKDRVFSEIFRVLKPGGELYFSDVFASRRIPTDLAEDQVLLGECLGGALYIEDFRRLLLECGCPDYRIVSQTQLSVNNQSVKTKVGEIEFYSVTIRAFKLDDLEDRCEDFGQAACYLGTLAESPSYFDLDDHHRFEAGRLLAVCGNTASMLKDTRYAQHFRVHGDRSKHYGLFNCEPNGSEKAPATANSCC